jgi:MoaA/NifB/PqqE/SkfB family radical SAM enzyme
MDKLDIVWNLTKVCAYNCKICCVNAIYASTPEVQLKIKEKEKQEGRELDMCAKLYVVDALIRSCKRKVRFDFSGGDPLLFDEDRKVIEYASKKIGKENIMISGTGYNFNGDKLEFLKKYAGSIAFTIDRLPWINDPIRPRNYSLDSLNALEKCTYTDISTKISTVLRSDVSVKELENLGDLIKRYPIVGWNLLRLHLAGRARSYPNVLPSDSFYRHVHRLAVKIKDRDIPSFHHSFKNECEAYKNMIGILPDGKVLACCWALDRNGNPVNDKFVLGKLPEQNLSEILNSDSTKVWKNNHKPCKTDEYLLKNENKRN